MLQLKRASDTAKASYVADLVSVNCRGSDYVHEFTLTKCTSSAHLTTSKSKIGSALAQLAVKVRITVVSMFGYEVCY